MHILIGYRTPFAALETAWKAQGDTLVAWRPGTPLPAEAIDVDGAVLDFPDAAKNLFSVFKLTRLLAQRGKPVAAINRDAPWNKGVHQRRLWALKQLRLLDFYLSHSLQKAEGFARQAIYFPNAADISRYHLRGKTLESLRNPTQYRHSVSFVGNIDDVRYKEHRERVEQLQTLREMLATAKIELTLFNSLKMSVEQQVEVIQTSLINLNLGAACDKGSERTWGLPERCYGIPACGGFLLSDARKQAADDFTPGEEWIDFEDLSGCVTRIQERLADFTGTRRMAEAAHTRVMTQHTYAHRAMKLKSLLTTGMKP
ncbi:MAG: glycosyltransferase [Magnetococcales bacterium]|nr:glycosyltransferase [Magnetococcales bacterium]